MANRKYNIYNCGWKFHTITNSKNNDSCDKDKYLFLYYLKNSTDVRRAQGKRYEIEIEILIYIFGIMSEQTSLNAIKVFMKRNKTALIKYLKPKHKTLLCKETNYNNFE